MAEGDRVENVVLRADGACGTVRLAVAGGIVGTRDGVVCGIGIDGVLGLGRDRA